MKRKNVLIATVTALILLAFAFQTIEASRVPDVAQKRSSIAAAQDEASISSSDRQPLTAAAPHSVSDADDLSQILGESQISDALPQLSQTQTTPTVTLRAASGATILFKTQNGRTIKEVPPKTTNPPHLILFRNGLLTESAERTLVVTVTGLPIPVSGVTVTLEARTQHGDPDLGPGHNKSILVWRESRRIHKPHAIHQDIGAVVFVHEFTDKIASGGETIATPTDYLQYDVTVTDADHPVTNPLYVFHQDYALLMENQWRVPLPEVKESADGAAPTELLLYYCDMVPFRKSLHDLSAWLPREEVTNYIQNELAPTMIEAFRVQTDDWDFPWYPAWTNPRPGGDPDQLTVALTDGQAWFHGVAPPLDNSHISIRVNAAEYGDYDTLTEGIMSGFHHELFHNLQRNISQELGGSGNLMGAEGRWLFFTEGTAMLATSVGQEALQFGVSPGERAFVSRANEFLGQGKDLGELNTSYAELLPYRAALYWRFLYEQCGGMKNGIEDPAAGMGVIRQTLVTLFSGNVVDMAASDHLVESMPLIMNEVFAKDDITCPFNNYEDSLLRFARAIYALRLDGGRCVRPGLPVGCWFYDPNDLYADPLVSTITYSGQAIALADAEGAETAGIGSSFGIDFIDVILDSAAAGKPMRLEFCAAPETDADHTVQLWELTGSGDGSWMQPEFAHGAFPKILSSEQPDGCVSYYISGIDTAAYDGLALIITRLDANENQDPVGEYNITLAPG
jgi:hypothetical protein